MNAVFASSGQPPLDPDGRTAYIQAGRTSATGCARLIGKEGLARSEQFRLTVLPDKTGCNRSPVSSRYVQYPILDGYLRRRPGAHMPNIDQIGPMNTDEPIVEPLSPLRNTGPRPVRPSCVWRRTSLSLDST